MFKLYIHVITKKTKSPQHIFIQSKIQINYTDTTWKEKKNSTQREACVPSHFHEKM